MANHNNFDDLIRAAQALQATEQAERARQERQYQQATERARHTRALAIAERQRTLAMAEYAARLLVARGVAPTASVQRQLPQTYTRVQAGGMLRRHQQLRLDPARYEAIAEGWLIDRRPWFERVVDFISEGGMEVYKTVTRTQGLILTSTGRLVQYVAERPGYPNEELGDITVHGPVVELSDDPGQNIVTEQFNDAQYGAARYTEEDLRWKLAQLVAASIPSAGLRNLFGKG